MIQPAVSSVQIKKVTGSIVADSPDLLAIEEPMEIRLNFGKGKWKQQKNVAVTMRTPGNDFELASGFLITEGIVKSFHDILFIRHCEEGNNIVKIDIKEDVVVDTHSMDRNFYTTSSCGICGKTSVDAVKFYSGGKITYDNVRTEPSYLSALPEKLRMQQNIFEFTGGLHAAALFNREGDLLFIREDVGRHNAVDKLIGAAAASIELPLYNYILLLSGRAGFELLQKAAVAGIGIVAAVGAPTSLAVEMAEEAGITLVGFLRDNRFNIYTHPQRIKI
ncbi:MAG: formate dehydrogenase accessory sulfurtransferase FdhD [Bacteroidota bacterium]